MRSAPLFSQVEYNGGTPLYPDDLNTADSTTVVPGNCCVFVIILLYNEFQASSMADNRQQCSFEGRCGTRRVLLVSHHSRAQVALHARAEARPDQLLPGDDPDGHAEDRHRQQR